MCEGERLRAITAVGSFVCGVARRGCTVWRKQKGTFVFSGRLAASQRFRTQHLRTITQKHLPHFLSVCLSLFLSPLLDKLWQKILFTLKRKFQEWHLKGFISEHTFTFEPPMITSKRSSSVHCSVN